MTNDRYDNEDLGWGSIVCEGETWYYQERYDTIDCTWIANGNSIVVTRKDNGQYFAALTLQENGDLKVLETNYWYPNPTFSTNPSQ